MLPWIVQATSWSLKEKLWATFDFPQSIRLLLNQNLQLSARIRKPKPNSFKYHMWIAVHWCDVKPIMFNTGYRNCVSDKPTF